jgi:Cu(I)/Ag(I) efflux system membrane fusion protein
MVSKGEYVDVGTPLLSVVDLSQVWVQLDAYEVDLPWLRYGQRVEIEAVALPAERITGVVSLIDPVVNPETRTVRVRVNVPNQDLKLKPEMLVKGRVQSRLASSGKVIAPNLEGKWISPMHPEVVKEGPGSCDVCGMPLVPAESLGYATSGEAMPPLVVPSSAVLFTGKRSIVYVESTTSSESVYEGREIILGARADNYFIIEEGLKEGERVVTNGAFKVDSAVQLMAGRSMMSQGTQHASQVKKAKGSHLTSLFQAYLKLQEALAADDEAASEQAASDLNREWDKLNLQEFEGSQRVFWEIKRDTFENAVQDLTEATEISVRREAFFPVSSVLIEAVEKLGNQSSTKLFKAHCPMAFNNSGADWLQREETINNPYFGSQMVRCGTIEGTYGSGH